MELKKNSEAELEITGMTGEGMGVGRCGGKVVFVPDTIEGERVRVQIVKTAKTFCYAKLLEVLTPSKHRIESDCPVSIRCGGCVYRHMTYEEELRVKQRKVEDALQRIGGVTIQMEPIVGADCPDHYRNKAQLPVRREENGQLRMGFFAPRSHRVVESVDCKLQAEIFRPVLEVFRSWAAMAKPDTYDERTNKGRIRHLYMRYAEKTGELMVCVVVNANGLPMEQEFCKMLSEKIPALKSVIININREKTNVIMGKKSRTAWGEEHITDELCGLRFALSPHSFYQVNRAQAEKLYALVGEYAGLRGEELLLDLYCGTGTIGLTMASKAKQLIGVEIVEQAVEDARRNAEQNGIENAEFLCADASEAAELLARRGEKPDVVLLDPPRKGCDEKLIETIASRMIPDRIVYVSCDPATLARDLKAFAEYGYHVRRGRAVDLFSRTAHVETVVLLSKLKSTTSIEVKINLDEMDLTQTESKATYDEIKAYVLDKYGFKVSQLYIAQVKRKHGIIERENYNTGEGKAKVPQVREDKEKAIEDALKHFQMI